MEKPKENGRGYYLIHQETWEEGAETYIEFFPYGEKDKVEARVKQLLNEKLCQEDEIFLIDGYGKNFQVKKEVVKVIEIS